MKYKVGSKTFKSKGECVTYTRNLLNGIERGRITSNHEHYGYISDLLKLNPTYPQLMEVEEGKAPREIQCYIVSWNKMNGKASHLEIQFTDGTIHSISWLYCCGYSSKVNWLKDAMRNSVNDQIVEFRGKMELKCERCGATNLPIEIDHTTKTFEKLRLEFLEQNQEQVPLVFDKDENSLTILKEGKFREDWRAYHREHAKLRVLCHDCHVGRVGRPRKCLL